jgi:uncharacterized membrane protein
MTNPVPAPRSGIDYWADRIVCWLLRWLLLFLLLGLIIWGILPFLAPAAYHWGYPAIGRAIHLLYAPFCHQLPQRSWFLFGPQLTYTLAEITEVAGTADLGQLRSFHGSPALGWKMAWSDRMVSFYFMTPIFGIVYVLLNRQGVSIRPVSTKVLILLLLPMFFDGITHMMNDLVWGISAGGFRDSNGWLALLTANRFPGFYSGDQLGTFNWWIRLLSGLLAAFGLAFYLFPRLDTLLQREADRTCGHGQSVDGPRDGMGLPTNKGSSL